MDVHGIIFDDEHEGEPVNLGGLDTTPCELVVGPGVEDGTGWKLSTVRGRIIEIRKVFGTSTCQNDADRGLLDLNRGRPFVRASAHFFDDGYAKCYADLVAARLLRWAGEGRILERDRGIARATLSLVRVFGQGLQPKFRVFPGLG